jgi:hypothetical protein
MRFATVAFSMSCLVAAGCGSVVSVGDGGAGGRGGGATGGRGGGATGGSAAGGAGAGGASAGGPGAGGVAAGGSGGESCQEIQTEYAAALEQAKQCVPGAANQCTKTAQSSLDCGCATHVNDDSGLSDYASRWAASGCRAGVCPAIACLVQSAICAPIDGGGGGRCEDTSVLTPAN